MQLLDNTLFVVTDIETTGLSPDRNRVTEIGCAFVRDGQVVDEKHTLINPEQFIPQMIQQMTGITNAMVLNAPKGDQAFPAVRGWFPDDAVFTAHNASFDHGFLQASFRRHRVPDLPHPTLCTVRLSRRLFPQRKKWNLDSMASFFGIKTKNRHSAMGDAHATATLLIRLMEILENEYECEAVEDVLSFQRRVIGSFKQTPANIGKLEPLLADLPGKPGVYFMHNRAGDVLYVGKAGNLRDRVGSYFRAGTVHSSKNADLVKRVRSVTVQQTNTELAALLLEAQMIKRHQPEYNRLLRRYRKYAFLRMDTSDPFPRIDMSLDIQPDGAEYYGPFRNRDTVEVLIDTIGHLFKLRECTDPLQPSTNFSPCIYHQLHRCHAPCAVLQSQEEYRLEVDRVRQFLSGSGQGVVEVLRARMEQYAADMLFEEAARLRDRIRDYQRVFSEIFPVASAVSTRNMVAVLPSFSAGTWDVFMLRHGRLASEIIVGARFPLKTLQTRLQRVYSPVNVVPIQFGKQEIEEMRIVAGYLHQRRGDGTFIPVGPDPDIADVTNRIAGVIGVLKNI